MILIESTKFIKGAKIGEGVCKSKRDKLTVLDVIADDKKLIGELSSNSQRNVNKIVFRPCYTRLKFLNKKKMAEATKIKNSQLNYNTLIENKSTRMIK